MKIPRQAYITEFKRLAVKRVNGGKSVTLRPLWRNPSGGVGSVVLVPWIGKLPFSVIFG